jgi:hypothetical protein
MTTGGSKLSDYAFSGSKAYAAEYGAYSYGFK